MNSKRKYAVIYMAWGLDYINEVKALISNSNHVDSYDLVLITDKATDTKAVDAIFNQVIKVSFEMEGFYRKAELVKYLPDNYDAYLYLDSDVLILEEISLGFEKAEQFGIAVSTAPQYSLDLFFGFDQVMHKQGVSSKGQIMYNSGVIFFNNSPTTKAVFERWLELTLKYQHVYQFEQPFFSLAMEELDFNPYTLSISYNYRGFGDPISGLVRVWHSHEKPPPNLNDIPKALPRRRAWPKRVIYPKRKGRDYDSFFSSLIAKLSKLKKIFH